MWPNMEEFTIDRHIMDTSILYCYVDASELAMRMCCFLGESFLFRNVKVAVQDRTIVEKELIALIGIINMIQKIVGTLSKCCIHPEIKIFSNSKININRLNMSPNKHKPFIARKFSVEHR